MTAITTDKDPEDENSISIDELLGGSHFVDATTDGVVLFSSRGSRISLDDLPEEVKELLGLMKP